MGLKKGSGTGGLESSGDEPDDEPASEPEDVPSGESAAVQVSREPEPEPRGERAREVEESYLARRDGAKDERKLVQFFLREEIYSDMTEDRLRADVGEQLGESPGRFDLREAMTAVAQDHVDEIVDELEKMGY